ncbi:Phosphoribosylaminoimidazole carboxylase [Laetiporus sulphureus 93-53]|uniref:Phosphoribosylaminoimidazole carboxylase n=1 Tax=Laetiporus sulphureus 93-53 TaxID=1314785 RepID=A0A165B240_9APHY|nr:Phosphoribosylaminoimidazole carboxylase [Laetiporus sulphureus 93-53]KZT00085.1 Phosphoribosylaminoimidazole carboxylase [Laetiporus sulphureus 93-53]
MLAEAASRLNVDVVIGEDAPAKQIVAQRLPRIVHVDGSFTDLAKIRELALKVDVLTVETEHVDISVLDDVQPSLPLGVHPSPSTIRTIQDKFVQKQHLAAHSCPVSDFMQVDSTVENLMLKSRTLAYNGRGNFVVRDVSQIDDAIHALGDRPLYVEKWVPFIQEIAVIVVRSAAGHVVSYPAVETVHKDNICHLVFAPLRSSDPAVASCARSVAEAAVKTLHGSGVFGVEMFLMADGTIYLNEIAPRPHNSGHYTIEACDTSQYENHLRAILSLPLGSTALKVPSAVMLNLLGASDSMERIKAIAEYALSIPGASLHLYGKKLPSLSDEKEIEMYSPLPPDKGHSHRRPLIGVIMGSDSDLPVMLATAHILDHFSVAYELTIVSAHRTPDRLVEYARSAAARGPRAIIAGTGGAAHLPGMVAAMTSLPVIGVPIKGTSLDGVDSLHSIVQMPRRVPVATVAINNATNAGLLAVRILGNGIPHRISAMDSYLTEMEGEVMAKVEKLDEYGWEEYGVKH